jgi:hypothetical protein
MEPFSITDCELYWDTRIKTSKCDRRMLKKELKQLSVTIGKAISFLKEAAHDGNGPSVEFIMGDNIDYELSLWISNSARSVQEGEEPLFEMNIRNHQTGPSVAHLYLCNDKVKIVLGVMEEEDQYLEADAIK